MSRVFLCKKIRILSGLCEKGVVVFGSTKRTPPHPDVCVSKKIERRSTMKSESKTKISSVHFKYVGTEEQFCDFIRSVIMLDWQAYFILKKLLQEVTK